MMNNIKDDDRELLTACATLLGYEVIGYHPKTGLRVWNKEHTHGFKWNPLFDDADAFRLAMAMSFRIELDERHGAATVFGREIDAVHVGDENQDIGTAARRAIVRATAQRAKNLKT